MDEDQDEEDTGFEPFSDDSAQEDVTTGQEDDE